MRTSYCLEMSYDGSSFFGWQSQPHRNTVQDFTETALNQVLGIPVRLVPASRTDTGVHAAQQFARFRVPPDFALPDNLLSKLKHQLPSTITIKALFPVAPEFNPRTHAKRKIYCYRLLCDDSPTSQMRPKYWRIYRPLDLDILRHELQSMVGTHDFSSFCASGSYVKTKVRKLNSVDVNVCGNEIEIWFVGEGFLKQMIRIIVGSAVAIACGMPQSQNLLAILAARDRMQAGKTAPGDGLTLHQIVY